MGTYLCIILLAAAGVGWISAGKRIFLDLLFDLLNELESVGLLYTNKLQYANNTSIDGSWSWYKKDQY